MPKNNKAQIIRDAVRRFPNLGNRSIARYILGSYGDLFDNDLEKIRNRVRVIRGKNGNKNRANLIDKSLYGDTPVNIPKTWRKTRTSYKLPPGLWLVLSDLHVPYHEPIPIEAAIQYGHSQKVSGIFINGDFQDCTGISFWYKERRDFMKEVEATIDMFDWLRQEFPKSSIVYKPGNHEYRLPRYYVAHAPELIETPLAAMETLLGFEERNIEFLDYHQKVMAGELPIIHGHEYPSISKTVNMARGLFLKTKTFAACSHGHSTSEHSVRDINDMMLTTWSFGCLCDLHPDWNPFSDWNWGFALINIEPNGFFEVENRRILPNGKVV
jgi:predicted phosphodiesterase